MALSAEYRLELDELARLMVRGGVLILSGAGISTESGIPDYRGPESIKHPRKPMQYREFAGSDEARARYWARSAIGWPKMAEREPNAGHIAVARMEESGIATGVVTQNVDGLHQRAGSNNVVELHGALREVVCMRCGTVEDRGAFQLRLNELNPGWEQRAAALAPDGDVHLPEEIARSFRVAPCLVCAGNMKPNVVFFGENVPAARVESAWSLLSRSDLLLVLGSSLAVYSGYRFVDRSVREGRPVAIINRGPTRGDDSAQIRIDAPLGEVLPALQRMTSL